MKPTAIAILCSDLHLSLQRPACRADKDWMGVQAGYLQQLKSAAQSYAVPVVCAGDIFDRWNAPPELVNFALEHLPDSMICVPGQHDLPEHRHDQEHRSGYGVLVRAKKIVDISQTVGGVDRGFHFVAYGIGWGEEIKPLESKSPYLSLAVIHRYMWINQLSAFPGADKDAHISKHSKALSTYNAVVIGDNHKSWFRHKGGNLPSTEVFNCGTFIRRKSDEINYRPQYGILCDDGTISPQYYDTSKDRFYTDAKEREALALDMKSFVRGLEKLGEQALDFREAVRHYLRSEEVDPKTKQLVLQALEADNK